MEATNVKDEMDSTSPAPTNSNGYTDYILRSSAPSSSTGWKFNVMKFATLADRVVDLTSEAFHAPVRLNRKDPRTVRRLNDEDIEKYSKLDLPAGVDEKGDAMKDATVIDDPTLGPDGKPLKEEMDLSLVGRGVKGLAPAPKKKGMFKQQRTKRVYVASEEARRLKREEWMPWVLEDKDANERWIGRLEGGTGEAAAASAANLAAAKIANAAGTGNAGWRPTGTTSEAGGGGSSYVAFVFGENGDDFKVVPASRWYKFNQGPRYAMLGVDEAETEYTRQQKTHEPERWMMHNRIGAPGGGNNQGSTSASSSSHRVKTESSSLTYDSKSRKPTNTASTSRQSRMLDKSGSIAASEFSLPGNKFKTVMGSTEFAQGDDEFEYEEDFQDDEEGIARVDDLVGEEEQKGIEKRMKHELKAAKGFESAEEEDDAKPNGGKDKKRTNMFGEEIKRLVRKGDKSGLYESDDDEEDNPYASEYDSVESDDSLEAEAKAARILATGPAAPSASSSGRPSDHRSTSSSHHRSSHRPSSTSQSRTISRSGSVVAGSSSGSALVAKRATSPERNSSTSRNGSRSNSPAPGSRSGSSSILDEGGSKRKRTESDSTLVMSNGDKRHKATSSSPPPPPPPSVALLTEQDLIQFIKGSIGPVTTMHLLTHFKKSLKDSRNKLAIRGLITGVASLVEGNLVLNEEWR